MYKLIFPNQVELEIDGLNIIYNNSKAPFDQFKEMKLIGCVPFPLTRCNAKYFPNIIAEFMNIEKEVPEKPVQPITVPVEGGSLVARVVRNNGGTDLWISDSIEKVSDVVKKETG